MINAAHQECKEEADDQPHRAGAPASVGFVIGRRDNQSLSRATAF